MKNLEELQVIKSIKFRKIKTAEKTTKKRKISFKKWIYPQALSTEKLVLNTVLILVLISLGVFAALFHKG